MDNYSRIDTVPVCALLDNAGNKVMDIQESDFSQLFANRHSFIDIDKVGIHGHSGGGFMSTAAICQYPDFFKVAVSCAGNHDNNIYNRWWSETHHGVKETVSDKGDTTFVYKIATNPEIAKNLKGHLLLVHGNMNEYFYWRLVDYFSEHLKGQSEKSVDIPKR